MKFEETTILYPFKSQVKYKYFEWGHICGIKVKPIKVKPQNAGRRIMCDCAVTYSRKERTFFGKIKMFIRLSLNKIHEKISLF